MVKAEVVLPQEDDESYPGAIRRCVYCRKAGWVYVIRKTMWGQPQYALTCKHCEARSPWADTPDRAREILNGGQVDLNLF